MQVPMELLAAVFGGTFFGSFFGPLLLEEYRRFQHTRRWLKPHQNTTKMLFVKSGMTTLALRDLAKALGLNEQETREVLVSLKGVGTTMIDGSEGWIIDRNKIVLNVRELNASSSEL